LNSENKMMALQSVESPAVEVSKENDTARGEAETELPAVVEVNDQGAERSGTVRVRRRHHLHRHRHSKRSSQWSERSKLLAGILSLALIANFFIVLFFGLQSYTLNEENTSLRADLIKSHEELDKLKPEMGKLKKDVESLLKGQLPGLLKIEYDQVITLNNRYVKNITFNKVNNKNVRGYEFRIVMHNDSLSTIWPKVKIHFFDEHGIQMNLIQVGFEKESFIQIDPLEPGEERSDSSHTIKLMENENMPSYFMIQLN
jgi:hypothetical protein